jgi:O-antigen/teichoic acid export membrane protein
MHLVKNSSKLFFADIVNTLFTLILGFIVARSLGVASYGLLALVMVYVTIVNQIIDFRIEETAVKYASEFLVKNDKGRLWATVKLCYAIDTATGIFAFAIVAVTAEVVSTFIFHNPGLRGPICLYAATLLFSTVEGTSIGLLTVFDKFSRLSFYSLFSSLSRFVMVLFFVLRGSGITGVLEGYVLASLVNMCVLLTFAVKVICTSVLAVGVKGPLSLLAERKKEITLFLCNTNINELLNLFTKNIDILILGYFRAPNEVGLYRLAKNVVNSFGLISTPFTTVVYPEVSRMWSGRHIKELKALLKKMSILLAAISLSIGILVAWVIPWVIRIAAGREYIPAAMAVRVMLPGVILATVFLWLRPVFLAMQRPAILTCINALGAASMVALSLCVVPRFGFIGSSFLFVYPYVLWHVIILAIFVNIMRNCGDMDVSQADQKHV